MTVRELINLLHNVKNKDMQVCCYDNGKFIDFKKINVSCRLSDGSNGKLCENVITLH